MNKEYAMGKIVQITDLFIGHKNVAAIIILDDNGVLWEKYTKIVKVKIGTYKQGHGKARDVIRTDYHSIWRPIALNYTQPSVEKGVPPYDAKQSNFTPCEEEIIE